MKISEKYASKYLKAEHLQGRAVRVQISHVEEDVEMGVEKELKDVVHFKGRWRPLVLNKTNAESLAQILGDDTAGWPGSNIVIYPVETQTGPGVRVQAYQAYTPLYGSDQNADIKRSRVHPNGRCTMKSL